MGNINEGFDPRIVESIGNQGIPVQENEQEKKGIPFTDRDQTIINEEGNRLFKELKQLEQDRIENNLTPAESAEREISIMDAFKMRAKARRKESGLPQN